MTIRTATSGFGHHDPLLPDFVMSGRVTFDCRRQLFELHDRLEGSEVLNADLSLEGHIRFPDEVIIRDWSEHTGLAAALIDAGILMRTETIVVGPFSSRAFRHIILDPEMAR